MLGDLDLRFLLKQLLVAAALLGSLAGPGAAEEDANSDRRIGVVLAVGDILACHEPKQPYDKVAAAIRAEIEKAGSVPVAVLALGDLAYSNRKNGRLASPTYADCFKQFEKHWGHSTIGSCPFPAITTSATT